MVSLIAYWVTRKLHHYGSDIAEAFHLSARCANTGALGNDRDACGGEGGISTSSAVRRAAPLAHGNVRQVVLQGRQLDAKPRVRRAEVMVGQQLHVCLARHDARPRSSA